MSLFAFPPWLRQNDPMLITSLHNERVKLARALQTQAKARRREGRIALEGARLVCDACQRGCRPDFVLFDPAAADEAALAAVRALGSEPLPASAEVMRHISATQQPQGIVGVFPLPRPALPAALTRLLLLDGLRDPGNLGTILRTAAAAGVQAVILSPDCADPYNPKALRAGMGAHFRIPVVERNWPDIAAVCAGLTVYLADARGDVRYDRADWSRPWALIIGGEAHGAGAAAAGIASRRVSIPMAAETESLNAAAAAAVLLFEAAQRGGR